MAIFISYSHEDDKIVERIAKNLVQNRHYLWLDKWELAVGDSLLDKVQNAIKTAEAILIVLSRKSVESSWCKKELNAGLMRELDENKIILLPLLIEKCDIPPFLKEKKYANFVNNFDTGIKEVLDGLQCVINFEQGRIATTNYNTDWAIDNFILRDLFHLRITLIEMTKDHPYTVLTEIILIADKQTSKKMQKYYDNGLKFYGDYLILSGLNSAINENNLQIVISDEKPQYVEFQLKKQESNNIFNCRIMTRRMGLDTGFNILVNISGQINGIYRHLKKSTRPLSNAELKLIKSF